MKLVTSASTQGTYVLLSVSQDYGTLVIAGYFIKARIVPEMFLCEVEGSQKGLHECLGKRNRQ